MMWGGPEDQRKHGRFRRSKWQSAACPVAFHLIHNRETFTWIVTCGVSAIPIAQGPANSVSEGRRIFKDAQDRYWRRKKAALPKARRK